MNKVFKNSPDALAQQCLMHGHSTANDEQQIYTYTPPIELQKRKKQEAADQKEKKLQKPFPRRVRPHPP